MGKGLGVSGMSEMGPGVGLNKVKQVGYCVEQKLIEGWFHVGY